MTVAPLLMAAAGLIAQAAPAELKPFTSKDGRFSVSLPAAPKEGKTDIPTPIGKIAMHSFIVEQGKNAFAVLYSDYPDSILQADPEKVLDGAQQGAVRNVNGKLVKGIKSKLGDAPGRDFEYEVEQPDGKTMVGRCRIYLDKARLYQVMIVAEPDVARSERSNKILDSLKITK